MLVSSALNLSVFVWSEITIWERQLVLLCLHLTPIIVFSTAWFISLSLVSNWPIMFTFFQIHATTPPGTLGCCHSPHLLLKRRSWSGTLLPRILISNFSQTVIRVIEWFVLSLANLLLTISSLSDTLLSLGNLRNNTSFLGLLLKLSTELWPSTCCELKWLLSTAWSLRAHHSPYSSLLS